MILSPLEQERFGVRTARDSRLTRESLMDCLRFCDRQQVQLLVVRCETTDLPLVHCLERRGFQLMDTLVYYRRASEPFPASAVRIAEPGEASGVEALARECFAQYGGHYHADPRLDRAACEEVYPSWAYRSSAEAREGQAVLVAPGPNGPLGFITLNQVSENEVDTGLLGVAEHARRQGIGKALLESALDWTHARGAAHLSISTQLTNLASQCLWIRMDFRLHESFYTFHKWFDR